MIGVKSVLGWLLGSRPVQWVLAALAALAALKLRDRHNRAEGREEQRQEQIATDVEAAAEIHRRAAAARDAGSLPVDPARPADTRGYRD